MFGAVYGDIIGSYYENRCTKEHDFPLQGDSYFTDDSVLIAAVCRAILFDRGEISRMGVRRRSEVYAAQYRQFYSYYPHAGFGQMFAAWAKNPSARRGHSYANGAAMRVIPIAYAYDTPEQVCLQVRASCLPTHSHPEAIKAATAVAMAVFLARHGEGKEGIRVHIHKHFYRLDTPLSVFRETHVFDSRASYSVPPAIVAFLESHDYESAVRGAVSLGGDADTQACIAGGIAEAYYRDIPEHIRKFCDPKLDKTVKDPIRELLAQAQ